MIAPIIDYFYRINNSPHIITFGRRFSLQLYNIQYAVSNFSNVMGVCVEFRLYSLTEYFKTHACQTLFGSDIPL